MIFSDVLVLGLGKVGSLAARLLHASGFNVTAVDPQEQSVLPFPVKHISVTQKKSLTALMKKHQAVISCLPYHLNKGIATIAAQQGLHYFDLTEDVPTTDYIRALAQKSKTVFAPQCGLAPGFIAIVGASLTQEFSKLRSIKLRVGALPQHPNGELGYAFNWSTEGVVNEYLNDCQVIQDKKIKTVPAMQDLESLVISGDHFEAFNTSGGLGTMCESYQGKVESLNYKTIRYPGHMRLMRFYFHELQMKNNRDEAGKILVNAKPPVNDDVVYIHAAVEGIRKNNKQLFRTEFVRRYLPEIFFGQDERAIAWTTACSLVSVVELVANGTLANKGFIKQEEIPLNAFLNTEYGKKFV